MRHPAGTAERLSTLHRLCKGVGLKALREGGDAWDVSIFGVGRGEDLAGLVMQAVEAMPEARPKYAVQAALGIELDQAKLTKRREAAAKILGVSERTLIRDEEVGLRLLDTLVDRALDADKRGKFKRADPTAGSTAVQKRLIKEVGQVAQGLPQDERIVFHGKLTAALFGA